MSQNNFLKHIFAKCLHQPTDKSQQFIHEQVRTSLGIRCWIQAGRPGGRHIKLFLSFSRPGLLITAPTAIIRNVEPPIAPSFLSSGECSKKDELLLRQNKCTPFPVEPEIAHESRKQELPPNAAKESCQTIKYVKAVSNVIIITHHRGT